ncbi:MAG: cysteine hydrolase family protein [Pseudomonadota bacterium]
MDHDHQNTLSRNTPQTRAALLLIDVQKGFDDEAYWGGTRNNPEAERVCGQMLHIWRKLKRPIFHIRHSSTDPRSRLYKTHAGFAFNDVVKPLEDEPVITKQVNSAFIGTDLRQILDDMGIKDLVIGGLTTDHCVSTTTRMAGNFGYRVRLISDACASFGRIGFDGCRYDGQTIHNVHLASLNDEFCKVMTYKDLLREINVI